MTQIMNHSAPTTPDKLSVDEATLRQIGVDEIAYVRAMSGGALRRAFPKLGKLDESSLEEDAHVWALFSAEGQPLALDESRNRLTAMAQQSDLDFVQVH